jgi:hypothetical protein
MITQHMSLWLGVYTKVMWLVLLVGQIQPPATIKNWARLHIKVVVIGCQGATHIEGIETFPILMGKDIGVVHIQSQPTRH